MTSVTLAKWMLTASKPAFFARRAARTCIRTSCSISSPEISRTGAGGMTFTALHFPSFFVNSHFGAAMKGIFADAPQGSISGFDCAQYLAADLPG